MKKLYIDIGGTYLRSEIHCSDCSVIQHTQKSQDQGLYAYVKETLKSDKEIVFVGISYAGQVEEGIIHAAPNITIDEKNIKARIESEFEVRLEIDNDLNCAARAEADFFQSKNFALLYVGTGLGAAVVDDGRLMKGSHNMAYELGHIPYKKAPFLCGCKRDNCLELFASGSGLIKQLQAIKSSHEANLHTLKRSSSKKEQEVTEAFEAALLFGAGTLITLANPELLVLGGGVVAKNPYLLELLKKELHEYTLEPSLKALQIELSALNDAPLQGAILLEKESL